MEARGRKRGFTEWLTAACMATPLFDYYGTPEYEEVKSILDQYEVSPAMSLEKNITQ